ncbi:MAG: hypothetical protein M0Z42_08295, partial [Actinomycetota bacterium]|nr:hypothetical protein [Actinomycetota bacterium]
MSKRWAAVLAAGGAIVGGGAALANAPGADPSTGRVAASATRPAVPSSGVRSVVGETNQLSIDIAKAHSTLSGLQAQVSSSASQLAAEQQQLAAAKAAVQAQALAVQSQAQQLQAEAQRAAEATAP